MVIARGEIWWAELQPPTGSGPGKRRPVVVVSADSFNLSRISTIVAAAISSNTDLAAAPGNVAVPAERSGLPKDSVVNVSQIVTLDKRQLGTRVGALDHDTLTQIDAGLRLVLDLVTD
ncbi:MAG: type II toxin-antitoxin system PemK/MazF family toxin [Actinomycetota bacterium]